MLGHLSFGVADLARAVRFYDAALAPLGYVRVWNSADQAGYGLPGGNDRLALKLQSGPVMPPGPGFHLALEAPNRAAVDCFHAEALRSGGHDAGAPGPRPHYGATYYAAFVHDPDGHKLEAVFQ
jgi:catechol 2,3-dioxygenase-like lactoylglutathione lyase family enzyme